MKSIRDLEQAILEASSLGIEVKISTYHLNNVLQYRVELLWASNEVPAAKLFGMEDSNSIASAFIEAKKNLARKANILRDATDSKSVDRAVKQFIIDFEL